MPSQDPGHSSDDTDAEVAGSGAGLVPAGTQGTGAGLVPAGTRWGGNAGAGLLITGAGSADGTPQDVLMAGHRVVAVGPEARLRGSVEGAAALELIGWSLLGAAAEPHAHLDKAFLAGRCPPVNGDIRDAVGAMRDMYGSMTADDIHDRARRGARLALRHGFTALRSHVDVGAAVGTRGVEALVALRQELAPVIDLQVVALPVQPVTGRAGADGRRCVAEAIELGVDVVGGAPWLDVEPLQAVDELTAAAADAGLPIDLHIDESTEAQVTTLERYLLRVEQLGLGGRATASHCVRLGQESTERALALAGSLAGAGVAVVTLPQTNLYLQGRQYLTRVPRGIPPLTLLQQAGVLVAAGGDNWRDPFNPLGRADPLETAALLVAAGHVSPSRSYHMVSEAARAAMTLPPAAVRPGDVADLLAIRAADVAEAIAGATEERVVIRHGRVVARTDLHVTFSD